MSEGPWAEIQVNPPPRGGGSQTPKLYRLQSLHLSTSWGAQPATANMTYIPDDDAIAPLQPGSAIRLQTAYGHLFWGLCVSDMPSAAPGGRMRVLQFADFRKFLQDDDVFGAFNMVEKRLIAGRRVKRYWHILPRDYDLQRKTFSTGPLSAQAILELLLTAPTVQSPWLVDPFFPTFHTWQAKYPVFQIDCLDGKKLGAALVDISERQGIVFTLTPTDAHPYHLWFERKGYGAINLPTAQIQEVQDGNSLSENPERVRVIGGRNLYQVLDLALVPDWNRNWEQIWDPSMFADALFWTATARAGESALAPVGTPYWDVPNDPEQMIGRQLAAARAAVMTVREYAALRSALPPYFDDFSDARMFSGRCRNDMPVELYLNTILFRAFRPTNITINGVSRAAQDLNLVGEQLVKVDPPDASGKMPFSTAEIPMGNGVAFIKGYNAGAEFFKQINPARFQVGEWLKKADLWGPQTFQIDNSGELDYILFDDAVFRVEDLFVEVDKYFVFRASPTLTTPPVTAALTFEAERFSYYRSREAQLAYRDYTEKVPDLYAECIVRNGGNAIELTFEDNLTATQKADQIAWSLLQGQPTYLKGRYRRPLMPGMTGTALSSVIDRVTLTQETGGIVEEVDYTNERATNAFTPERDFDRRLRSKDLLSGEAELRQRSEHLRLTAKALRLMPTLRRTLGDAMRGAGSPYPKEETCIADGTGTLDVGTPLFKEPELRIGTANTKTRPVMPAITGDQHTVFSGVTVREGESATAPIPLQVYGPALARVKGPVEIGEAVVRANGENYLVGQESGAADSTPVGIANEAITAADGTAPRLIRVALGMGAGTATDTECRWA